ncbi:hypothetical protein K438DRAFT_1846451 [Mycena galopus ATCC 62051]|nr:hypothetical protein K438DRAFT_1846451 [Mycena galopus ATCC 62051]
MSDNSTSSGILQVSIVGAGIAGLTAALALRRNGHHVQIFEASEIKTEVGAALGAQVNALRVLDHLGISRENLKGVPFTMGASTNVEAGSRESQTTKSPAGNMIGLFCHRSDLHDELKRQATGDGEGPPVDLHLGTKVLACDPDKGTISLANGEIVEADLILGADGVHSVIRTHIIGEVQKPSPVGVNCFRAIFEVQEKPELQWVNESSGVRAFVSKEGPFRMLLMYPCRNKTLLNFIAFYADSPDTEGWTPKASRQDVITKFQGFHPEELLPVLDLPTHSEIFKWRLAVLPELPTWIRGRAAILGDAAHATLPFLAQGAAIAIEEAGSIGCLFPSGTKPQDVPERLKAYQDIRKDRGEYVRIGSVEQLKSLMNGGPFMRPHIQAPILQYDAIKVARECYEERFGHAAS